MTTPVSQEALIKMLVAQCFRADLWIGEWRAHRDATGVRNAAMAIGKLIGIYSVLLHQAQGEENVPEAVVEMIKPYQQSWDILGTE